MKSAQLKTYKSVYATVVICHKEFETDINIFKNDFNNKSMD